jgi:drug/metabolite transporter (DMT)-like permease
MDCLLRSASAGTRLSTWPRETHKTVVVVGCPERVAMPMTSRPRRISATGPAIVLVGLAWGSAGPFNRAALIAEASAFQVAWSRSVLVAFGTVLLALASHVARRDLFAPGLWQLGGVLGVTNVAIRFAFFSWALTYISAGFAGILAALIPAVTILWARQLGLGDRLSGATKLGLVLGFVGALTLAASGDSGLAGGGNTVMGFGICFVSIVSGGFASSYSKVHIHRYHVVAVNAAQFIVGSLVLLPVAALSTDQLLTPTSDVVVPVIGLGLIGTLVPFLGSLQILRFATVTSYSIVNYVVPVVAAAIGVLVLDEELTPTMVAAGGLVVLACWLVNRSQLPDRVLLEAGGRRGDHGPGSTKGEEHGEINPQRGTGRTV